MALHDLSGARDVTAPPREIGVSEVRIVVPAREPFVRTVRLVTGDAAARAGFGIEQVDDIRLAVTELCYALLTSQAGTLELSIVVRNGRLAVEGLARGNCRAKPELDAIAGIVVDVIADRCVLSRTPDGASFNFEKHVSRL